MVSEQTGHHASPPVISRNLTDDRLHRGPLPTRGFGSPGGAPGGVDLTGGLRYNRHAFAENRLPLMRNHDLKDGPMVRYWRSNLRIMAVLLIVWMLGGVGAGILWADRLNAVFLPGTGFPLGFWFAHQGSIVIFVCIILLYCLLMNRLDRRHHREIAELQKRRFG